MKIAPLADVKTKLSNYINLTQKGPIIVTKNGHPRALLAAVPENEDDLERLVLALTPKFRRIIDAAYKRIQSKGGIRHKDFWQQF